MPDDPRRRTPRTDAVLADARLDEPTRRLGPALVKRAVAEVLQRCREGALAPDEVVEATSDYRAESDKVARFCSERLRDADGKLSVTISDAFKSYVAWCDSAGVPPW